MCLWQAEKLNDLQSSFLDAGIADVQTIIINNLHPGSQAMMRYLRRYAGEVPVYQDTNTSDVWQQLEGGKDDFFIYDRCGRLAYYVPMPLSLMFKPYALAAILSTYYDEPCGPCPQNPLNKTEEILCSAEENLINPNCTLPRANRTLEILNDTFNQDNNTISHLSQDAGQHNNTLKKYAGNALESLENSTDSPANQIHAFRNHPHRTDTGAADSTQKPEQHRHHSHHHHHHLHHHHSDPVDSRPHSSHQQNENDKQHSAATISTLTNRKNMTHPILTAGHTISSSSVTGQEKLKSEIHTHHHTTSGRGNGHAVSNVTQTSQNISESNEIISAHESKARIGTVRPTSKQIYDKYENYEMALQNALHTWLNRPIPNKVAIAKEENTTTTPVTTTATTTKKPRGRNRNRQNRRRKNRRKQTEDQSTPGHHHHHP